MYGPIFVVNQVFCNDVLRCLRIIDSIVCYVDEHQITTVENTAVSGSEEVVPAAVCEETSKDVWYKDYDELSDPPDAGEIEDADSDGDDYEDYSSRRSRKKKVNVVSNRLTGPI